MHDGYIYMDGLLSRFVLRPFACFGVLLAGSMDEEGIGSVVAAPFAVTLTMCHCEGKCAEKGTSLRKDACADRQTGFLIWHPH